MAKADISHIETKRHIEALDLFYRLGGGAATDAVADEVAKNMHIHERTVWKWFENFHWRKRMDEWNEEVALQTKTKSIADAVETKARHRVIVSKMVDKFEVAFDNGDISLSSVGDYEKLVKLDLILMGEKLEGERTINIITAIPRPPGYPKRATTEVTEEQEELQKTISELAPVEIDKENPNSQK